MLLKSMLKVISETTFSMDDDCAKNLLTFRNLTEV